MSPTSYQAAPPRISFWSRDHAPSLAARQGEDDERREEDRGQSSTSVTVLNAATARPPLRTASPAGSATRRSRKGRREARRGWRGRGSGRRRRAGAG